MKASDHRLYWDGLAPGAFDGGDPKDVAIGPYHRIFRMRDDLFDPIRDLVFAQLAPAAGLPTDADTSDPAIREEIRGALNQTTSIKVDYDMALMTRLDVQIHRALNDYGLLDGIKGIEFPVNVRVAHGAPPPGYLDSRYATDMIHCDPWTQGPGDIVNCLLYIDFDTSSSPMDLYHVEDGDVERLAAHTGDYIEGQDLVRDLPLVDYRPGPGTMIMFDAFCPHATNRKQGAIRVSIDFRLRREDPYAALDDRWLMRNVSWAKYWHLNTSLTDDYEERCESELAGISGNEQAVAYRRRALGRV